MSVTNGHCLIRLNIMNLAKTVNEKSSFPIKMYSESNLTLS